MAAPIPLRSALLTLAIASIVSGTALAQAPAPAKVEPEYTLTGNVGLFSQYVFRGISQTDEDPAVQGGIDFAHKSGIYLGTWASNVSWLSDGNPDVSASMEWDFYGGYKLALAHLYSRADLSQGYPLEVIRSQGDWLEVRDFENDKGWIYRPLTGNTPHHVVKVKVANLRSEPTTRSRIIGRLVYGDILRTLERKSDWVKVQRKGGMRGWIALRLLWGW